MFGGTSNLEAGGTGSNSAGTGQTGPTITFISPANSFNCAAPVCLSLSATASEAGGNVTNVCFMLGTNLLVSFTGAPYTLTTSNLFAGAYALTAVATDNSGVSATSSVVTVTVTNSPALATLQSIKTVFVIALENHDLVQANPEGSPQQIWGNPAAPYFNSLITPGNSNAAHVSFATRYYSVAFGAHPSEQNYVWTEAGTDFGVHTDKDPTPAAGNVFSNVMHLTGQLTAAGIPWRCYEEDMQYSTSSLVSASGSGVPVNPYNGTTEYNYAVKHNPMAFFPDTQNQNVYPLTNFWTDLTNNNLGRYNWIGPDQYNEMHSALPDGFVYHGVLYNGNQAAIAEGDNCLSIVIPQIMASPAYQDHGAIVIWTDETESTDDTNTSLPFLIISPLARGNAYACPRPCSHSSLLKTMDEIFGLAWQNNAIPIADLDAQNTGYNAVNGSSEVVNDLGDFFLASRAAASTTNTTGTSTNASQPPTTYLHGAQAPATTPTTLAGGAFQWSFAGTSGQTYEVLASSDLNLPHSAWTVVATGTFNGTNAVFTDPNAALYPKRYYVVKSP